MKFSLRGQCEAEKRQPSAAVRAQHPRYRAVCGSPGWVAISDNKGPMQNPER